MDDGPDAGARQGAVGAFLRAGFGLIPIPPGAKAPCIREWQKRASAIFGPENAAKFNGCNAGLVHEHSRTCAVDVDDFDAADAWFTNRGVNLETMFMCEGAVSVSSGRSNRGKLLFRLPASVAPLRTVKPEGVRLEFRCAGAQDVIAGKHPSGSEYSVIGDPAAMPELPEALLTIWRAELNRDARRRGNGAGHGVEAEAKLGAGERNAALTREAGRMRRIGLSAAVIEAALLQMNRERCDPPLPDKEAATIAASVGRYEPGGDQATKQMEHTEASTWPEPIDLAALANRAPQRPQFVLADWLPIGYATLFAGHGGVGKSAIALHAATCVAMGLPFFGIQAERRRVLYLSCEDRERILHWRLAHICAWLGLNMAELAGHLDVLDLVGHDTVLWERDPRTGYTVTPALDRLATRIERTRAQVLVVDGVSDAFGGNENARTEVKRFVNRLLAQIPADDGAVLFLGHINKPSASDPNTSEGYSGSTQWHNAVRARWYLYPETEKDEDDKKRARRTGKLLLELQKSNLGPIDRALTFAWDEAAHMFLATGSYGTSAIDPKHREETEQLGILRALQGCAAATPPISVPTATRGDRTAYHVLSNRPEFPDSLKKTKRFWARIEQLRQLHHIEEQESRRSSRKPTWHFVLTAKGCARCAS
jgi:hypothetical protein